MPPLLVELLRPHRRTIIAVVSATLVQIVMALAVPWPLKSVLDNVVGNHPAPLWISWLLPVLGGDSKVHIAEAAALLTVAIAVCTALVLWRGSLLVLTGVMTIGSLSIFLAYLARFFTPVRDLAQMTNTICDPRASSATPTRTL